MHITMLMALICNVCQLAIMPSFGYIIVITAIFYYVFTFRSQIHVLFLHTYLANGPKHGKQNIIAIRMREVIKSIISKDYPPDWCLLIDFFFLFAWDSKWRNLQEPHAQRQQWGDPTPVLSCWKNIKRPDEDAEVQAMTDHSLSLQQNGRATFFSFFFLISFRGLMGVLKIVFLSFYDFFFHLMTFC